MAEPKKILLVSYCFAPQNVIGAIRATKLAKYLTRLGHEVTVICGPGVSDRKDDTLERDAQEVHEVRVVREWNPIRQRNLQKEERKQAAGAQGAVVAVSARSSRSLPGRVIHAGYLAVHFWADRNFYHRAWRAVKGMNKRFDVVLSSYGPWSSHEIACQVKKHGIAGEWVADFRDEVTMPFAWQQPGVKRYIQKVKRTADVVCAVSQGVLQIMELANVGCCLMNGFDVEDLQGLPSLALPGEKPLLTFAYCGQMYGGKQDVTPFFVALRTVMQEQALRREDVKVLYAGGEGPVLRAQAETVGLGCVVHDMGGLSRSQSLALQQQADILLMASWNTAERVGVLTGKLMEYMMMNKPVICCVAGEIPDSEMKQVMDQTGLGFCWEQARAQEDTKVLIAYLKLLVDRARHGEPLSQERKPMEIEKCAYSRIAEQLCALMEASHP